LGKGLCSLSQNKSEDQDVSKQTLWSWFLHKGETMSYSFKVTLMVMLYAYHGTKINSCLHTKSVEQRWCETEMKSRCFRMLT